MKIEIIKKIFTKANLREEPTNIKFLAKGNHNDSYLVKTSKNRYVLRVENNPQFKNLKKEYEILKIIEKLNVGPKVFLFDKSHKIILKDYILEEFVPGKFPRRKVDKNFVKIMAKWFKKLHSFKTSKKPEDMKKGYFSLIDAIRPYYNNFKKYGKAIEKNEEIKGLYEKALIICKKEDKLFVKERKFSILHRDPSRENILVGKNNVKLIDWEFAEIGLPEWELVYFIGSYKFTEENKRLFLKTYGFPQDKSHIKRLEILYLLNICGDVGYSLWRLDLLKENKIKENKIKRIKRLKKDIELLKRVLIDINNLNKKRLK